MGVQTQSQRNQTIGLFEAFFSALMIGAGETYLPAYAISIGLGEVFAGVLATLPIVSGAFLQLLTPQGLLRLQNPKRWVIVTVTLQAMAFIPLILFSLYKAPDFWSLFFVLTLYWGAGFAAGPAWNYWMGRLIEVDAGNQYFSRRAQATQLGVLLGLILGGVALHNKISLLPFAGVFGSLFVIAFAARLLSSLLLSAQHFDQKWMRLPQTGFRESLKLFWKHSKKKRFFMLLVPYQASVFITGPFVVPYLLAQVKMDYGTLMVAIASLFFGKIFALQLVNRFGKALSPQKIFLVGAVSIAPLPMFWAASTSHFYIFGLQFVSGMCWALVEVGLSLIFFKDLKESEKVSFTIAYNFLNSLAIIVGTTVGAQLLFWLGSQITAYKILFFVGGFFRILFCGPLFALSKAQHKN